MLWMLVLQYRDLPADAYLAVSLYEVAEGYPLLLVGSTSMPMFSTKGRLKTGQQRLQVRQHSNDSSHKPLSHLH